MVFRAPTAQNTRLRPRRFPYRTARTRTNPATFGVAGANAAGDWRPIGRPTLEAEAESDGCLDALIGCAIACPRLLDSRLHHGPPDLRIGVLDLARDPRAGCVAHGSPSGCKWRLRSGSVFHAESRLAIRPSAPPPFPGQRAECPLACRQ